MSWFCPDDVWVTDGNKVDFDSSFYNWTEFFGLILEQENCLLMNGVIIKEDSVELLPDCLQKTIFLYLDP